jgi:primary-amine oxidase
MRYICFLLFSVFFAVSSLQAQEKAPDIKVSHPLDALTPAEIKQAADLLRAENHASKSALFGAFTLIEPDKAFVRAWKSGDKIPRQALAIIRDKQMTKEAVIDVTANKIISVTDQPGKHPMIMDRNWVRARDAFMKDERLIDALKMRGISDIEKDVFCTPNSAGVLSMDDFENRHIVRIPCYTSVGRMHPNVPRSIEGLTGIVDAETGEVLSVLDFRNVPMPAPPAGYGEDTPPRDKPLKPVTIAGSGNVKVTGNYQISWHRWSMHARADKRAGLVLSLVSFDDGKTRRDIAYQMNLSELFVPYMDPDANWAYRTFLDAGEFGLGYLISSLQPGVDCPVQAFFADLTFPNDVGGAFMRPKALCIFERPTGDPAWRHYSAGRKQVYGVAQTELVVRHIPTLGNYDYVVDYVFSPQGNIKLRVGSTGFDATKSTPAKDMDAPEAATDALYGNLIAPFTVAPSHDHYFNFRLDLDVDGAGNTLVQDFFVPAEPPPDSGRKTVWTIDTKRYLKEGPVAAGHDTSKLGPLRVINPDKKNLLKQPVSYWLNAHHDAQSIMADDDASQARAGFSQHQFWVTRNNPKEFWAAGTYPNLQRKDEGLPTFVSNAEDIAGQDLVVWYTMGFRHITRPEDFPILPTFWHEMTLRPAFFFDRDPSMTFNPGDPK